MKMKTRMRVGVFAMGLALLGIGVEAADAVVAPANVTNYVNAREDSVTNITGSYVKTTTLMFTNSSAMELGGSITQSLVGVIVEFRVGNTATNIPYTGTVYAIDGVTSFYWVAVTVPDITGTVNLQTKLTDSASNVYIYPLKRLTATDPLD